MPDAYERVVALARRQDDMVTRRDARRLGMSEAAIAARRRAGGWRAPVRGTLVLPPVRDRVRAHARAALAAAGGIICLLTAARLHRVPGLPPWAADEAVDVAYADSAMAARRRGGCRRHLMAVPPAQLTDLDGVVATSAFRTLQDVVLRLERAISIPVLRAVQHLGWLARPALLGGPALLDSTTPPGGPGFLDSAAASGGAVVRGEPPGPPQPGIATDRFAELKEEILRRNDNGEGPGGGPEFWRLLARAPAGGTGWSVQLFAQRT